MTTSPDQYTLPPQPVAAPIERPKTLFSGASGAVGLRAATGRLSGGARLLDVWFYGDPPAALAVPSVWALRPAPGAPRPEVTAVAAVVAGTDADGTPIPAHLTLTLGGTLPGRGVYQLRFDPAVIDADPLRVYLPVRLRPECGDVADCVSAPAPPKPMIAPDYDTLARDYPALRAMLLERLQVLDPDADLSIPDVTVTLAELFAHLGDLLHYRLDRGATEGWLPTARRRANVVRHARAVDFAVPPAISASTVVQVVTADDAEILPRDTTTVKGAEIEPRAVCFTLEGAGPRTVLASHAEIELYDWTEDDATLTEGATSAVLIRPAEAVGVADWIQPGDLLGFEVVAADDLVRPREPLASHPAQVVTVTAVADFTDPLTPGIPLVRVFWDDAESLREPVPCSVTAATGGVVGVARLGLFRAHHGLIVDGLGTLKPIDRLTGLEADPETTEVADWVMVAAGPEAAPGLAHAPGGRPWQLDVAVSLPNGTRLRAEPVPSMLRAASSGFSVVVDADDELPALMRFRTGELGLEPPAGSEVSARYQVGAGPAGNIAANVTDRLVRTTSGPGVPCVWLDVFDVNGTTVTARNITPGTGGAAAMPLEHVRRDAPEAYSAVPRRAVLTGDLPGFAIQVPGVLRASARRTWSGSWPVGVVAYEHVEGSMGDGVTDPQEAARTQGEVQNVLYAVRMAGTEVVCLPATPVGILLALTVCLFPGSDPGLGRASILAALRPGTPDAPGLFAPGQFRMGTSVYLSSVVAAVAALPQVDAVAITEARRLSDPVGVTGPVLVMGPTEVAICDDDPNAPDRGHILLTVEGGR